MSEKTLVQRLIACAGALKVARSFYVTQETLLEAARRIEELEKECKHLDETLAYIEHRTWAAFDPKPRGWQRLVQVAHEVAKARDYDTARAAARSANPSPTPPNPEE